MAKRRRWRDKGKNKEHPRQYPTTLSTDEQWFYLDHKYFWSFKTLPSGFGSTEHKVPVVTLVNALRERGYIE